MPGRDVHKHDTRGCVAPDCGVLIKALHLNWAYFKWYTDLCESVFVVSVSKAQAVAVLL